jgi:UDP-2,4-diacetamido-2,4,6-trideoxy-beta-L-altropyranose hydrolase
MKIFIRADGGKNIGIGHVMRMLVLGKELQKDNEVIFICRDNLSNKFYAGIKKIKEYKFPVIKISELNYIDEIIQIQNKYNADLLITDSYEVDKNYFTELKSHFKITGYVDDINKCEMDVDFIINQNINACDINYSDTVKNNTKLFLGTKYCMLRDEFRKAYKNKILREDVKDVLLTLGGMDNDGNTLKALEKIKTCSKNIHVVIGNAFEKELVKKIYDLSGRYENIYVYEYANMSELMLGCDIAISACGSTLYELCAMKVPAIGIILAENQKYVAKKMKDMSLIIDCFNVENIENFNLKGILNKLIEDKKSRKGIIKNQQKLVDLYGVKNLSCEINHMLRIKK